MDDCGYGCVCHLGGISQSCLSLTSRRPSIDTFWFGGKVICASIICVMGQPVFVTDFASKPMRVRVICEIIGRLLYTLAIAFTPLPSMIVILQATQLVFVAGAS